METKLDKTLAALMYEAGFSLTEIGKVFKVSKQAVHQVLPETVRRKKPGFPKWVYKNWKFSTWQINLNQRILDAVSNILTDWTIGHICESLNLHFPKQYKPNTRKPGGIFPTITHQIVTLWNCGLDFADISYITGRNYTTISSYLARARKTGVHVRYKRVNWTRRLSQNGLA